MHTNWPGRLWRDRKPWRQWNKVLRTATRAIGTNSSVMLWNSTAPGNFLPRGYHTGLLFTHCAATIKQNGGLFRVLGDVLINSDTLYICMRLAFSHKVPRMQQAVMSDAAWITACLFQCRNEKEGHTNPKQARGVSSALTTLQVQYLLHNTDPGGTGHSTHAMHQRLVPLHGRVRVARAQLQ